MEPDPLESDSSYREFILKSYEEPPKADAPEDSQEHEYSAVINVINPVIQEGRFRKHVLYTVTGSDYQGTFSTERRYKDFKLLREILDSNWPGCYIPLIPPKVYSKNFQPEFIENRRKLLQEFLLKIVNIPHLLRSREFQIFIREQTPFQTLAGAFPKKTTSEILKDYLREFEQYSKTNNTQYLEGELDEIRQGFLANISRLESLERACDNVNGSYDSLQVGLTKFNSQLNDFDQEVMSKSHASRYSSRPLPTRNSWNNPFLIVLDWLRQDLLDHQAIISSIGSIQSIKRKFNHTMENLSKAQTKLNRATSGKLTLTEKLGKKSVEEVKSKTEVQVRELEDEVYSLERIYNIVGSRFTDYEIKRLREWRGEKYGMVLRSFGQLATQEFNVLARYAELILSEL